MKKQNPFNKLFALVAPYIVAGVVLALFILGFFVFSYVLLFVIVVGLIITGVGYFRQQFFHPQKKPHHPQHKGRIIDQEKE